MKSNPEKIRAWQRRSREAARARELEKRRARSFEKKPQKPRKTLRQCSPKRGAEMRLYYADRRAWLALPKNSVCAICLCLGRTPANRSTEVHHKFGRVGKNLRDERGFVSCCRMHRDWPHDNPSKARELGLLGSNSQWNVRIDRHKI